MKSQNISTILSSFGISAKGASFYTNSQDGPAKKSSTIDVFSPIDNQHIGQISQANDLEIENAIQTAKNATKKDNKVTNEKIKIGICGEHGGDPSSIHFCKENGLDYVSCSPFRVPIARLSAAQAEI